jgi:hypothetical protein
VTEGGPLTVRELIDRGDLDELLRRIDGLCAARDWDGLLDLRDRALRAVDRGFQLWPAAHHAEYRLALEAPAEFAAAMLTEGTGRFAIGPLAEVAASTHTWAELAPFAPTGPVATIAAHERVVRGEDLRSFTLSAPGFELPLALEPWEPAYELAHYESHRADFPAPRVARAALTDLPREAVAPVADRVTIDALVDLVQAWTTRSNGRAEAVTVESSARDAVRALGPTRAGLVAISPSEALALMAWAAASGGARAARPGAAAGRFGAWWAAAALTDLVDEWPVDPAELGAAIDELRWYSWTDGDTTTGWALHIAVEDPESGLAWALAATDHG